MNERIKKLAEQAGYTKGTIGFGHWHVPECQKFAELIVRECMDVVRDINQEYDGGSTIVNAAEEIRYHFGVE